MRPVITLSLCISVSVFVLTPLHIFANNAADLATLNLGAALLVCVLLAALSTALLSGLSALALRFAPASRVQAALTILLIFVVLTGFLLPLTAAEGEGDVAKMPINWLNLLLAAGLCVGLYVVTRTPAKSAVLIGLSAFVGVTAVTDVWSGVGAMGERGAPDAIATLSSERNILVVTFDGVSNAHVLRVLEQDEALRESFADFNVFRHVASSSPATNTSLANVLGGDIDLREEFETQAGMLTGMAAERRVHNRLAQAGYDVTAYGNYGRGVIDERVHVYENDSLGERPEQGPLALELIDYALARTLTPRLAFARAAFGELAAGGGAGIAQRVAQHEGPANESRYVLQITDFERYRDGLRVETERPVAHFVHFLYTHHPVNFDERCVYLGHDEIWFRDHQDLDGATAQTRCALNQFASLLAALKRSGAYDNSLIVLASDHGLPPRYYDPDSLDSFTVREHRMWGVGRYEPMLAIKAANQHGAMRYDDRPVILGDLARTICIAGALDGCESFHGYDLLQSGELPTDATYFIHLVRDAESDHRLESTESYRFRRTAHLPRAILDMMLDETVTTPLRCGDEQNVAEGRRFNNGSTDASTWATWHEGQRHFLRVQYPACARGLELALADGGPSTEVRVNDAPVEARASGDRIIIPLPPPRARGSLTISLSDPGAEISTVRFTQ